MGKAIPTVCLPNVYLDPEVEKELQDRLSRIEGHMRGVKRMLAAHGTCEDLLLQLAAIRSAVNQVQARLLENHLETCVADAVHSGKGGKALERLKGALAQVLKTQ
ncbi:MAG: metal-sensitive transcriptional regulator [Candidatus Acidiferrales bacterium]